jgi:hypothetical protein
MGSSGGSTPPDWQMEAEITHLANLQREFNDRMQKLTPEERGEVARRALRQMEGQEYLFAPEPEHPRKLRRVAADIYGPGSPEVAEPGEW